MWDWTKFDCSAWVIFNDWSTDHLRERQLCMLIVNINCHLFNNLFVMSSRVVSVFQHRCKASTHLHWSRGCSVWLLCFTAWSRWREIVSLCVRMCVWERDKESDTNNETVLKTLTRNWMQDDILIIIEQLNVTLLKNAGWCSLGRAAQ